jgi:hypothetical protein
MLTGSRLRGTHPQQSEACTNGRSGRLLRQRERVNSEFGMVPAGSPSGGSAAATQSTTYVRRAANRQHANVLYTDRFLVAGRCSEFHRDPRPHGAPIPGVLPFARRRRRTYGNGRGLVFRTRAPTCGSDGMPLQMVEPKTNKLWLIASHIF